MHEPTFLIMRMAGGYAAVSNSHGHYYGRTLVGLGTYLRDEMRAQFGIESDDVEFVRGEQLTPSSVACGTCSGSARVQADILAGQYLGDAFGTIDWTMKATRVCPTCAGLGSVIPGFWEPAARTA